jgi:hypothetical protein
MLIDSAYHILNQFHDSCSMVCVFICHPDPALEGLSLPAMLSISVVGAAPARREKDPVTKIVIDSSLRSE